MNVIQKTTATLLQTANELFADNKKIKEFSETFQQLFTNTLCPCLHKPLCSLEKKWALFCQEFAKKPATATIVSRLKEIQELAKKEDTEPCAPSTVVAEILATIELEHFASSPLKCDNKAIIKSHPKTLQAGHEMLQRIMKGAYGLAFKYRVLNSAKNPLLVPAEFLRMLFVDGLLHARDPKVALESFATSPSKEIRAVKNALRNFRDELVQTTGLSLAHANYLLLSNRATLDEAIKTKIQQLVSKAYLDNTTHLALVQALRFFYQPTNGQLVDIAYEVARSNPEKGYLIASLIEQPDQIKAYTAVLVEIFNKDEAQGVAYLERLQAGDKATFQSSIVIIAEEFANSGKWQTVKLLSEKVLGTPAYETLVLHVAASVYYDSESQREDFFKQKEEMLIHLLTLIDDLPAKARILHKFIKKEINVRFTDQAEALHSLENFIGKIPNQIDKDMALSSSIFYLFKQDDESLDFKICNSWFAKIENVKVRKNLLRQIVELRYLAGLDDEATIKSIKQLLTDFTSLTSKERLLVQKLLVEHAAHSGNVSKQLIQEIPDPMTQIHLERFIKIPITKIVEL